VQEAGVPGFDVVTWNGLFVPAKTPADVIALLNADTRADLGLEPRPSTPAELGALMASEVTRWGRVIAEAGIERQ
jgi:tripartite-type tricarboxylate transporter receptor subunit TctC